LIYQPIGRQIVRRDVLVVRGVLQKCLTWRGRILDFVTVDEDGPLRFLYAIDISPLDMWPADVRDSILRFYAKAQPDDPAPRVTVEVFSSHQFEKEFAKETSLSLLALYTGACPNDPPDPPAWWSGDEAGP
jgi:hypothetical protein